MSIICIPEQYRTVRASTRLTDLKSPPWLSIFVSTLAGHEASFALVIVIGIVFDEALDFTRIAMQSSPVGLFIFISTIARSWRPGMLRRMEEESKKTSHRDIQDAVSSSPLPASSPSSITEKCTNCYHRDVYVPPVILSFGRVYPLR